MNHDIRNQKNEGQVNIQKQKIQIVLNEGILIGLIIGILFIIVNLLRQYSDYYIKQTMKAIKSGIINSDEASRNLPKDFQVNDCTNETETIRVKLLGQDYKSEWHSGVSITSADAFYLKQWQSDLDEQWILEDTKTFDAGEVFEIAENDMQMGALIGVFTEETDFTAADMSQLQITSFTRAYGHPKYSGSLYLYREKEGIVIVNEVSLNEYLYHVVPSEIPADYPIEAQKAQAVCARTYALKCKERAAARDEENDACIKVTDGKIQYDLNDSVSYQVYNNYEGNERSKQAVDSTAGEMLAVEEALYYSTSCLTEIRNDLNTETAFAEFLNEVPDQNAEYGSPWIRWMTEIRQDVILRKLSQECGLDAECVEKIKPIKRKADGQLQTMEIYYMQQGNLQSILIEGEYQIRKILSPEESVICLQDGSEVKNMLLLPSAFMIPEMSEQQKENPVIKIYGGGYGHGIGMSQNGAAAMAEKGADYKEILQYYYDADVIRKSDMR